VFADTGRSPHFQLAGDPVVAGIDCGLQMRPALVRAKGAGRGTLNPACVEADRNGSGK
jgi:hypothetical protein